MKNAPAFPTVMIGELEGGMTLRDYFAAKAMQSLVSSFLNKDMDTLDPHGWMDGLAMDAYSMADAMLKAREE
jgi:hypothetical protein